MTSEVEPVVGERLARIEEKVDTLIERSREDRVDMKARVRALEAWRYGTGAALITAVVALLNDGTIPNP
jgi:hypothetical protein